MDLSYKLQSDKDGIYDMQVLRNGQKLNLNNIQLQKTIEKDGTSKIHLDFSVYAKKVNIGNAFTYSFKKTASIGRIIWISLGDLISGKYKLNDLSGPVGIVNAIGQTIDT